jgi:hydrogenase nickel incorporation protein HypA/HybF
MHEVAIVDALIEQVEEEVRRAEATGRVTRLELPIGRLSGVNPDSIRFALELLTPGTLLESARVDIRQPQVFCACSACGTRTEIDDLNTHCPRCSSPEITLEGGRELTLETIELEDPTS